MLDRHGQAESAACKMEARRAETLALPRLGSRQPFSAGARTNPPLRDQLCQAYNKWALRISTSSPDLCIVLVTLGSDP